METKKPKPNVFIVPSQVVGEVGLGWCLYSESAVGSHAKANRRMGWPDFMLYQLSYSRCLATLADRIQPSDSNVIQTGSRFVYCLRRSVGEEVDYISIVRQPDWQGVARASWEWAPSFHACDRRRVSRIVISGDVREITEDSRGAFAAVSSSVDG